MNNDFLRNDGNINLNLFMNEVLSALNIEVKLEIPYLNRR